MITATAVLPQFIQFGDFRLSTYGIIISLSIGILSFLASRRLKLQNFKPYELDILLICGILGGILLGRLFYVGLHIEDYYKFSDTFKLWEGGIHLFGVLLGAFLGLFLGSRILKKSFVTITDSVALFTPLVQAFGRLGNLANMELFGKPTDLPWGFFVTTKHRPPKFIQYEAFHPVFAYEAILSLLNFAILIWLSKKNLKPGTLTTVYFLNYAIIRFFIEFLRIDTEEIMLGLKLTQIICLGVILIAGLVLVRVKRNP